MVSLFNSLHLTYMTLVKNKSNLGNCLCLFYNFVRGTLVLRSLRNYCIKVVITFSWVLGKMGITLREKYSLSLPFSFLSLLVIFLAIVPLLVCSLNKENYLLHLISLSTVIALALLVLWSAWQLFLYLWKAESTRVIWVDKSSTLSLILRLQFIWSAFSLILMHVHSDYASCLQKHTNRGHTRIK